MEERPYFKSSIGELEALYRQHPYNKKVLTRLDKELAFRKVKSARRLHALVRERLDEIRQKDGKRPLLSPFVQKPPRRPTMEQGNLLTDTPQDAKAAPETQPSPKQEVRQVTPQIVEKPPRLTPPPAEARQPTETVKNKEGSRPPVLMLVAVLICLACLIFVILSTKDKTFSGAVDRTYEEQVKNLLN